MASPLFVFCLTCLWKMASTTGLKSSSSVHQTSHFVSVQTGDNLTLQCFNKDGGPAKRWYKQTLGQKPRLISTYYLFDKNATFYGEFSNNPRFTLDNDNDKNHLTITDVHISDSATYYCISCYLYSLEFSKSTTVIVQGSGLIHQSVSETIQPGDSVTLNCKIQTGTCDGEHSVYWFKDSEESHPGIIYTHGDRHDQCERKRDTQTHNCVYNLPMNNLNVSHAGTYYCAVASCGHILFGNGTKLDFKDDVDLLVLVYFLSGAWAFTTILAVLLVISLCKTRSTESQERVSSASTTNTEGFQDADNLHYSALSVKMANRSRKQRNGTKTECVYSSVKQ